MEFIEKYWMLGAVFMVGWVLGSYYTRLTIQKAMYYQQVHQQQQEAFNNYLNSLRRADEE